MADFLPEIELHIESVEIRATNPRRLQVQWTYEPILDYTHEGLAALQEMINRQPQPTYDKAGWDWLKEGF